MLPKSLVQSKLKNCVGSIFYSLASITAGLDRKKIITIPMMKRKNLVKAKGVSITPIFFHRISRGSEALLQRITC